LNGYKDIDRTIFVKLKDGTMQH